MDVPSWKEKGWREDGGRFLGYPGYYLPVERIFLLGSVAAALTTSQLCGMAARLLQVSQCKVLAWFSQSNSLWAASDVNIKFLLFQLGYALDL